MTVIDGRQVAETIDGIRADHVARYRWAAERLAGKKVLDLGCGVGYGSRILADAGCRVMAYDQAPAAIVWAHQHYATAATIFRQADITEMDMPASEAAVCFEVIEHLQKPAPMLSRLKDAVPVLLGSVPNETVMPFDAKRFPYHYRHYTIEQLQDMLETSGWKLTELCKQGGPRGEAAAVTKGGQGQTIVFAAVRV